MPDLPCRFLLVRGFVRAPSGCSLIVGTLLLSDHTTNNVFSLHPSPRVAILSCGRACVFACMRASVRACVHACMRACVSECVRACVGVRCGAVQCALECAILMSVQLTY